MRINDRVMVSKEKLKTYGQQGIITCRWPYELRFNVRLDNGRSISIDQENLILVEDEATASSEKGVITVYVLFMHDRDNNPASLAEASNDSGFNFQEPACVSINIDSIKEVIEEDRDTWQNAYVVANNKIYPVNMKPECPGLF